jgi:SWI/SNF-related matrix-associated actin-dependent regulator of chromatin subfamily B protein 1
LEETRLFKRSGTGRSRRAGVGQRDLGEDSDESESDESSAGSPAISHLAQGTARTRGMRTAATVAQNAMRATMGRSATPEVSHEIRAAARRRDYREESVETEDRLIVKLRINPAKFRQFLKDMKSRPKNYTGSPAASTTRGSMGPPQSHGSAALTPKRLTASQINGVIDAPHPPQPGVPPVSMHQYYAAFRA